jgi:hypothetical protein
MKPNRERVRLRLRELLEEESHRRTWSSRCEMLGYLYSRWPGPVSDEVTSSVVQQFCNERLLSLPYFFVGVEHVKTAVLSAFWLGVGIAVASAFIRVVPSMYLMTGTILISALLVSWTLVGPARRVKRPRENTGSSGK